MNRRSAARLGRWIAPLATLFFSACSASKHPGDVLVTNVADLVPHSDSDHFVYASERDEGGKTLERTLMVEHVSTSETPGEFQVTESANGVQTGDTRWIADEHGIALLSEEVEGLGVRLQYDPPLLFFPQPLLAGEHRAAATGSATSLEDGQPLGLFHASVVVKSNTIRSSHPLASGKTVAFEVTRSIEGPNGALVIHVDSVNAEGVGEIESIAALEGFPFVIRRSLVCGLIKGHPVGQCDMLK